MNDRGFIVVTGASTGIGEAAATRLAAQGFTVFAGVRKEADAERLQSKSLPGMRPLMIDVADDASVSRAATEVTAAVGDAGLQVPELAFQVSLQPAAVLALERAEVVHPALEFLALGDQRTHRLAVPLLCVPLK